MDLKEIKETPIWTLYERGRNFHRMQNIYDDTDRNYRFYEGNQWQGAKFGEIEPVQKNFIRPILNYKLGVIHDNLYSINFSSLNFEMPSFRKTAEKCCELLNGYVARLWEQEKMDKKLRKITKAAGVNGEGIAYCRWESKEKKPMVEIVDKCDVYYGDEQEDDIQQQPYILIRRRLPLLNAILLAKAEGMDDSQKEYLVPDKDTFEEAGDASKNEVNDQVTIVYKLYKSEGTVHYAISSRFATIVEDTNTGLSRYPLAHMNWEDIKGSARGIGEVKPLIANQIEVNKIEMRRIITVKTQAHPHTVVDTNRVANASDLKKVGSIIETEGMPGDDVRNVISIIPPAQMSPDVKMLSDDLVSMTRELAGAGDVASGDVDPENASGRAILAVQNAQRAPITAQRDNCKDCIEDIALIWFDMFLTYAKEGIPMEEKVIDPTTTKETYQVVVISPDILRQLKAIIKIDITPKSAFDKFAQEQTLENLLLQGFLSQQRIGELKAYAEALPDDAVSPKMVILDIIDKALENQRKIALLDEQAKIMEQETQQFLLSDPDDQAKQINAIRRAIPRVMANVDDN